MDYLNDQDKWTRNVSVDEVWSREDREAHQRKLDTILGKDTDGTPRLRLVWGGDMATTLEKSRFAGDLRFPRYEWVKGRKGTPISGFTFVGVPRFFIEWLIPESQMREDAALLKRQTLTNGEIMEAADLSAFRWMRVLNIESHPNLRNPLTGKLICCEAAEKMGEECYGRFRLPDEGDLQELRGRLQDAAQWKEARYGENLTDRDYEKIQTRIKERFLRDEIARMKQTIERRKAIASALNRSLLVMA